ncbi:hypothetical protein PT2222_50301 [Paraburkholderia tropica]
MNFAKLVSRCGDGGVSFRELLYKSLGKSITPQQGGNEDFYGFLIQLNQ